MFPDSRVRKPGEGESLFLMQMLNFICPCHVHFKTSFCFLKKNAKNALNWQPFLRRKLLQPLDQIDCACHVLFDMETWLQVIHY